MTASVKEKPVKEESTKDNSPQEKSPQIKKPSFLQRKPKKKRQNTSKEYDFTNLGDPAGIQVERNGVKKRPARQLLEIFKFVRANKIKKMNAKDFSEKLDEMQRGDKNSKEYPGVFGSIQRPDSIFRFYIGRGDVVSAGVVITDTAIKKEKKDKEKNEKDEDKSK